MDTTMSVNLDEVAAYASSNEFVDYIVSHNTNLAVPAFIMQAILNEIERCKKEMEAEGE